VSVHANGGKVRREKTCLARVLEGFGGCRFIEDEGVIVPLRTLDEAASDPVRMIH